MTDASRPSNPSNPSLRIMSAARTQPETTRKQQAKAAVENATLNALSVAKEQWEGFRRSDRFFKYRVLIVGSWLLLSAGTLVAACPTSPFTPKNSLHARLVIAGDASRPVYMVVNDGKKPWQEVLLIVNGEYQATTSRVDAQGNWTLGTKQLLGANGKLMPAGTRIRKMVLRTGDGETVLVEDGELQ